MGRAIDRAQIQAWLERYGDEVGRMARAAEGVEVGAEELANALWFCAHCAGENSRALARGQQLLAGFWSMREEGELKEGPVLDLALALCAWGRYQSDESCTEEAQSLFWQSWRKGREISAGRVELSFWVALLELGSTLLVNEEEREMHIAVSRCVATLLNDYYDLGAKTFYSLLDFSELKGTGLAPASSALRAVDALMCEAVRCGDGRLFDWGDTLARSLAARGDLGDGAGEMLRLVGLRSLRHRAASWGTAWIEREFTASDLHLDMRVRCLCLRELALLAGGDEAVSGALHF